MTREEWGAFKEKFYRGDLDRYDVMGALIDAFWETQDLQHELAEAQGRIYELEETLDGRG